MTQAFIQVPEDMFDRARELVSYGVRGDCLNGDHIRNGDYIIVDRDEPVADGDIAVVRTRAGMAVKHLWRDGAGYRLVSANPAYPPITVPPEDSLQIVGKVVGVIRYRPP
jgi:repressor LexA